MSNIFSSRSDAREYAKNNGGKVRDRGSHLLIDRWEVVKSTKNTVEVYIKNIPVGYNQHGFHKVQGKDNKLENLTVIQPLDYSKTHVVITPKVVSVTLENGEQHTVSREKDQFTKVVDLAMQENYEEMMKFVDLANAVKELVFGSDISIKDGVLRYRGEVIDTNLTKRIIKESQLAEGSVERYINFFRKLYRNPSYKAVQYTYDFLVHNDLEILEDGNVKGYKGVRLVDGVPTANYSVPNYKGCVLEMPRNQVEDNPNVTCSHGLHIGAYEYANDFGSYLLEVSFSPEDVVSVPIDYNNQKLRACRYEVLTGVKNEEFGYLLIDKNGNILKQLSVIDYQLKGYGV